MISVSNILDGIPLIFGSVCCACFASKSSVAVRAVLCIYRGSKAAPSRGARSPPREVTGQTRRAPAKGTAPISHKPARVAASLFLILWGPLLTQRLSHLVTAPSLHPPRLTRLPLPQLNLQRRGGARCRCSLSANATANRSYNWLNSLILELCVVAASRG